jgi:hypothetical protein
MSFIKIGIVALMHFVILLSCSLARAQDDKATSAARAFDRGQQLFEKRAYVSAITEFELAYRLKPHYAVQCSIAQSNNRLGRVVEAAKRYRRCLKEGGEATPRAARIQRKLKAAEARIVWVDVLSPGDGGTIYVDGLVVGLTPRRLPLNPGKHVVVVRRVGALPATTTIHTQAGEKRTVSLLPSNRPPKSSGATSRPVSDAPKRPTRRGLSSVWFWSSAALTIALTGAAIGFGVRTYQLHSDYEGSPTKDGYDSFVNNRLITNVFSGLAMAAAGGTTLLYFYTDFSGRGKGRQDSNPAVSAVVGVQGVF